MPKILDAPHKIISLNVLATGQLILTTENRVYEQKNGLWTPMVFADDPVEPVPAAKPLFGQGTASADGHSTVEPAVLK